MSPCVREKNHLIRSRVGGEEEGKMARAQCCSVSAALNSRQTFNPQGSLRLCNKMKMLSSKELVFPLLYQREVCLVGVSPE